MRFSLWEAIDWSSLAIDSVRALAWFTIATVQCRTVSANRTELRLPIWEVVVEERKNRMNSYGQRTHQRQVTTQSRSKLRYTPRAIVNCGIEVSKSYRLTQCTVSLTACTALNFQARANVSTTETRKNPEKSILNNQEPSKERFVCQLFVCISIRVRMLFLTWTLPRHPSSSPLGPFY